MIVSTGRWRVAHPSRGCAAGTASAVQPLLRFIQVEDVRRATRIPPSRIGSLPGKERGCVSECKRSLVALTDTRDPRNPTILPLTDPMIQLEARAVVELSDPARGTPLAQPEKMHCTNRRGAEPRTRHRSRGRRLSQGVVRLALDLCNAGGARRADVGRRMGWPCWRRRRRAESRARAVGSAAI